MHPHAAEKNGYFSSATGEPKVTLSPVIARKRLLTEP
jgi:hypothetical protein